MSELPFWLAAAAVLASVAGLCWLSYLRGRRWPKTPAGAEDLICLVSVAAEEATLQPGTWISLRRPIDGTVCRWDGHPATGPVGHTIDFEVVVSGGHPLDRLGGDVTTLGLASRIETFTARASSAGRPLARHVLARIASRPRLT